jgi:hypothetical protein
MEIGLFPLLRKKKLRNSSLRCNFKESLGKNYTPSSVFKNCENDEKSSYSYKQHSLSSNFFVYADNFYEKNQLKKIVVDYMKTVNLNESSLSTKINNLFPCESLNSKLGIKNSNEDFDFIYYFEYDCRFVDTLIEYLSSSICYSSNFSSAFPIQCPENSNFVPHLNNRAVSFHLGIKSLDDIFSNSYYLTRYSLLSFLSNTSLSNMSFNFLYSISWWHQIQLKSIYYSLLSFLSSFFSKTILSKKSDNISSLHSSFSPFSPYLPDIILSQTSLFNDSSILKPFLKIQCPLSFYIRIIFSLLF